MTGAQPLLVAATDDDRLASPDFEARLDALLAGGCTAVWLRSRALGPRRLLARARLLRRRCDAHGSLLWVGDRVDVAALAGADHVQLPERGLSLAGARRAAAPSASIGRSIHSAGSARAAAREGADLVVAGTVFATDSHADRAAAGTPFLQEVRAALAAEGRADLPLVAIGGLTPERAAAAVAAGADGVAAIRALWEAEDPADAARAFLSALRRPAG